MGFFSTKKIITVSSTLYNMAGDENDRSDFIKGTIFGSVMSNSPSLSDDLQTSLLGGPGMKQRQFFRYADRNDIPGMTDTTIVNKIQMDPVAVQGQIPASAVPPAPAGLEMSVVSAQLADGDFEPFIVKWILLNHPTRVGEAWLGEFNPTTNTFSVEFPNNDFFSWLNDGIAVPLFDPDKRYIWAKYIEFSNSSEAAVVAGTPTVGALALPDLTGFTQNSDTLTFTPVTLVRNRTTIYSYSNGDPDVTHEDAVNADVAGELNTSVEEWSREVVVAQTGIQIEGERQFWHLTGTDSVLNDYNDVIVTQTDLGGGLIRTETATTTGDRLVPSWTTQYDTQALFIGEQYGPEQIFIYEVGSGNATLDALVVDADASGYQEFFPFMPIRIKNVSITEPQYETAYNETKKAYRRAYQGKNFDDLIASVEDNPSIDDIDYAYLCFGVSLNVKENACKKYVFKFLEQMIPFQNSGSGTIVSGMAGQISAYDSALADLRAWESQDLSGTSWLSILSRPALPKITQPALTTIKLKDSTFGFDYRLSWVHCEVNQYTGSFETDPDISDFTGVAKIGELHLCKGPSITWDERQTFNGLAGMVEEMTTSRVHSMYIYWQTDETTYRRLQVWGLTSENVIYKGKSVKIDSSEALDDVDESGFLIPLHYPTMSSMNIVDYTQMATADAHILFNSYTVTKQRWYERGIFKILLVILVIVIAVVVFPGAFAGAGGILGSSAQLGISLGFAAGSTAALVAGVVANYIAAIIVSELLSVVGVELFGEKWGNVFAAIATFAMTAGMSSIDLTSAQGLLNLGSATANAFAGWVEGDIAEMNADLKSEASEYEKEMDRIDQKMKELMGGNNLNFNPMFLTSYNRGNGQGGQGSYMPETADEYIRRTTMTGSDIVEITHSMVYDYVDVARTLPRN